MAYALQPDGDGLVVAENLASGLRRIAGEQAKQGAAALTDGLAHEPDDIDHAAEDAWDDAIHDARKRCKKVRAVARFCRDALGADYRLINVAFRDTARPLATARDAWTLVESVDVLASADTRGLVAEDTLAAVRSALQQRYIAVRGAAIQEGLLERARLALTAAAAGIPAWPLPGDLAAADLQPSIRRVYGRGMDGLTALRPTLGTDPQASTALWHDWRKRVKYLWYQVRLVEPTWPEGLTGIAAGLDELAGLTGDDHDLGVLTAVVRDEALVDPGMAEQMAGAAAAVRQGLRARALPLAEHLYLESPEAFSHRLAGHLALGREALAYGPTR